MKRCRGRKARKGLRRCSALGVGLKVPGILVPPGSSLGLAWKQVYRAVVLLLAPSMSSEKGLLRRFQVWWLLDLRKELFSRAGLNLQI